MGPIPQACRPGTCYQLWSDVITTWRVQTAAMKKMSFKGSTQNAETTDVGAGFEIAVMIIMITCAVDKMGVWCHLVMF